ncbi:DUF4870 domain-containing protein [Halocatena halophila]|uniref:DUF4870 domain-containing protein n=1 Tax=Halocatena halophila TaxID=2814576 RepID=UPI002ED14414
MASPTDTTSQGTSDGAESISTDERQWAILLHASGYAGLVLIPFVNVICPFVLWLLKKEESEFLDQNGRNAVNFQITWTIGLVMALASIFIGIGLFLFPVGVLAWLILVGIGAYKASEYEVYDYPLTYDFFE